jgi:ankyrin repeat protein
MRGNAEEVGQFITKNPKLVNENRGNRGPPLVDAAQWGKNEIVALLVTNGAEINAHGVWGRTALHFAANRGDAKMVEFLLKHKADVKARDEDGFAPIIQARGADVIKLLLAYGADINAHGGANTVFSQTLENPKTAGDGVLELLLTNGVDVTVSGTEGLSQLVLFSDDTNTMKLLVPYYVGSTNPAGLKLLQQALEVAMDLTSPKMASAILSASMRLETNSIQKAARLGDDATVRSLLAAQPDLVNKKDSLGWAPLHTAAIAGQITVAETLLANRANPNLQDDTGNTPLLWAAYFGHSKLVELLLRHKADMEIKGNTVFNASGDNEVTPLDFAIQQGFTSIAVMLITNGANLGSHKHWGDTPLHIAVSVENVEVTKLLLGANGNARRGANYQQSPLDIAVKGNSPEIVHLLIANGVNLQTQMAGGGTLFHVWSSKGNPAIADQLSAAGLDVNAKEIDGKTALHVAVVSRQRPAIQWLFDHKAEINAEDKDGLTPLHYAAKEGGKEVVQLLLDHNANVNEEDNKGRTPLAYLVEYAQQIQRHFLPFEYNDVVKLLLAHGAIKPATLTHTNKPPQEFY